MFADTNCYVTSQIRTRNKIKVTKKGHEPQLLPVVRKHDDRLLGEVGDKLVGEGNHDDVVGCRMFWSNGVWVEGCLVLCNFLLVSLLR